MSFLCFTSFYLFAIQAIIFYFLQISGEVVRLLETDGDFLVRETVRNDEKQIVLSVRILNSFLVSIQGSVNKVNILKLIYLTILGYVELSKAFYCPNISWRTIPIWRTCIWVCSRTNHPPGMILFWTSIKFIDSNVFIFQNIHERT